MQYYPERCRTRPIGPSAVAIAALLCCPGCNNPPPGNANSASASATGASVTSCDPGFSSRLPPIEECGVGATGDDPLIDDFEDGDLRAHVGDARDGEWYVYTDETDGCIDLGIESDDSSVLHAQGQGFSNWGAGFGLSFKWNPARQTNCLYDAKAYSGIRLRARGNAALRLAIGTKTSTFESLGGNCPDAEGCFDRYGRALSLTSKWQTFQIDFCSLAQEGWGTGLLPFSPDEVTALDFLVRSTNHFDVWVDDIEFIPRADGSAQSCAPLCPLDQLPAGIAYDPAKTPTQGGSAGLSLFTFEQQSRDCGTLVRRYLSYVPKSLGESTDAPILLLLPGTSSDAESMHQFMTGGRFVELADRDGFVLVYANAAPGAYTVAERLNGGRFSLDASDNPEVDDTEYLKLIVDDLIERGLVSGDNPLYLAGHSIGGGLALEAAMADPERYRGVAAIMPFDSSRPKEPDASTDYALERLLVAFTHDDPDLPTGYDSLLPPLISKWADVLGVSGKETAEEEFEDRVVEGDQYRGDDATALRTRDSHAKRRDLKDPESGRSVRVLEFDHAGHFWPMQGPYEDDAVLSEYGFRNQDLDMSDQIWDFFKTANSE